MFLMPTPTRARNNLLNDTRTRSILLSVILLCLTINLINFVHIITAVCQLGERDMLDICM